MSTDAEKQEEPVAAMINRVLTRLYDCSETWQGDTGMFIAYLALAMSGGWLGGTAPQEVDCPSGDDFIELMRLAFEADDPVWKFIKTSE